MGTLTIGQVAERADVGVETIRFYERRGLIDEPPRSLSGYRQYAPAAVERLRFVRRAKDLGFSLEEIKELLALRLESGANSREVRDQAEAKLADLEDRIEALVEMRQALRRLIAACNGRGPVGECPILESLGEPGVEEST